MNDFYHFLVAAISDTTATTHTIGISMVCVNSSIANKRKQDEHQWAEEEHPLT